MNLIFNDNVRILCLSCNVKKVGKLVRFRQKGQKQASFLAFHKCFQGCLLRGPRYIYNIRILSVNIKFICTSFRKRQNSEPSASFSGLFRSEYK
jgi:hypothetical protein